MTLLQQLQRAIEFFNGVRLGVDAGSYLIDNEKSAKLPIAVENYALLLSESGDGVLELGIRLDDAAVEQAGFFLIGRERNAATLESFLGVVEELSHFVLAAWKAKCDMQFSCLELETQGMIDKYFITAAVLHRTNSLHKIDFVLKRALFADEFEKERDRDAARFGYKYIEAMRQGKIKLSAHQRLYRSPVGKKMSFYCTL